MSSVISILLRFALASQVDAVVPQALAVEPIGDADPVQEVDRVLLQQPRPGAALDVVAVSSFEDHRLDPVALQQQCERQSGRARADNANVRSITHNDRS